jgi:hypothetical protein
MRATGTPRVARGGSDVIVAVRVDAAAPVG